MKGPDMAEDSTDTIEDTRTEDTSTDTGADTADKTEDSADKAADMVSRTELDKVIAQRDKLKAKLREQDKPADKTEPTESDKLRAALARTAGDSVLSAAGIADKADREALLSIPGLADTLSVGSDGSVDTDALTDALDTLRRIFTPKEQDRRAPKVIRRPEDSGPSDPDSARYKRIMGGK